MRIRIVEVKNQNLSFLGGLNFAGFDFDEGRIRRIRIESARAITPPSFDGMDRRITYAKRKYHSGWMWGGAIRGFAGLKFSTSPRMYGFIDRRERSRVVMRIIGVLSFREKAGLNFNLSVLGYERLGWDDPFSWRKIRCVIAIIMVIIGRRKWSEKNRLRVGLATDGPPQIHVTRSVPRMGIAVRTPVITVAPQKDICPHGRT